MSNANDGVMQLLAYCGIQGIKDSGKDNILAICPRCEKKKFYIHRETAQFHCKRMTPIKGHEPKDGGEFQGCIKGNGYHLLEEFGGVKTRKLRREMMVRWGLAKEQGQKQRKGNPRVEPEDLVMMSRGEIIDFCALKGISTLAFNLYWGTPHKHHRDGHVLLPAFGWGKPNGEPQAILRASMDGSMIKLSNGELAKYPAVAGSTHCLFGMNWIKPLITKNEVPYNTVVYCEGWRDMLAVVEMRKYIATANTGGSGAWNDEWIKVFKGRHVVLIGDRDNGGNLFVQNAYKKISWCAKSVRNITLPFEFNESKGMDGYDFLSSTEDVSTYAIQPHGNHAPPAEQVW